MNNGKKLVVLTLAMIVTLGLGLAAAGLADERDEGWSKLFNGKDLSGWLRFSDAEPATNEPRSMWSVKDGMIVCEGSVNGYIVTEKEYENFVLRLEWRWGEKVARGRNSGVFVHVHGPNKIWPKAVEAQLMADHAGDFWLVDEFKLKIDESRHDPKQVRHYLRLKDDVEKPLKQWNQYVITCKGNTVKLEINGHLVNEGTEAERTKGRILLQSEGAEIHFRNIELKPIK